VARLYLDSDVSRWLAPALRAAGHDTTTAHAEGRPGGSDDEQLLFAAQAGRVLLTHNRDDFVLLHGAWRRWPAAWGVAAPAHPGILVLDHRPETELTGAVDAFLGRAAPVPLVGALYWWRARLGWHHQLADRRWVPYSGR
jgi:hypothetical protein